MQDSYEISYLLNTISKEYKRVRFHGLKNVLIQDQAEALDIPLLQKETTGESYEQEFKDIIKTVIPEGVRGVVFGDIFLHMRKWADKVCTELKIQSIEPLCGHGSEEILLDFIDSGFEAIVVATQANLLDEKWLGRKLDKSFLEDIKKLKNIDVCGENGEYHTLVVDGPIFRKRIDISKSEKVLRDGYWFLDIQEYGLTETSNKYKIIDQAAQQFAEILVDLIDEKNSIKNKDLLDNNDSDV
jgi:uncharacterized protein (TIGR00290 family)